MEIANRTLTVDVIAALTYWPGVIWGGQKNPPDPVDLTVLPPFFNEVLQELLWWNPDWKVSQVEPGLPLEIESDHHGHPSRFTEVSVPGTVGSSRGESLPFVAKVGFAGDQLIVRSCAKRWTPLVDGIGLPMTGAVSKSSCRQRSLLSGHR
jgi:hypothetical protein